MLTYPVGKSGQTVLFTEPVLQHFCKYQQRCFWQREAGGQLFARITNKKIEIAGITGPRRFDWRLRFLYQPHRPSEQAEINSLFYEGLHYIGDWHTHPQNVPKPSNTDLENFAETVRLSQHEFASLLLVIVGTKPLPEGLYVSLCNGISFFELQSK